VGEDRQKRNRKLMEGQQKADRSWKFGASRSFLQVVAKFDNAGQYPLESNFFWNF